MTVLIREGSYITGELDYTAPSLAVRRIDQLQSVSYS
jgi:hypothetical protein